MIKTAMLILHLVLPTPAKEPQFLLTIKPEPTMAACEAERKAMHENDPYGPYPICSENPVTITAGSPGDFFRLTVSTTNTEKTK